MLTRYLVVCRLKFYRGPTFRLCTLSPLLGVGQGGWEAATACLSSPHVTWQEHGHPLKPIARNTHPYPTTPTHHQHTHLESGDASMPYIEWCRTGIYPLSMSSKSSLVTYRTKSGKCHKNKCALLLRAGGDILCILNTDTP